MSFSANVQGAFYYPGLWIMFLLKWKTERLSYLALQELDLIHVAVAFTLCYLWLSRKRMVPLAAVLGAFVYAYSGYLCLQLQHLGLVIAYAWMPLGMLGIDEATGRKSWLPLWKTATASALAFLGGYPPSWVVFAIVAGTYSIMSSERRRTAPGTVAAFVFSLGVCAVQLLPSWDATHFRDPENHYGTGIKDAALFISYFIPNYFDFGMNVPVVTNFGQQLLYLGAPGILGILLAFHRRTLRTIVPAIAITGVALIFLINPYDIVWNVIRHWPLLPDIVRAYYFLAGVALGLALLAAHGLNNFFSRKSKPLPNWLYPFALILMFAWSTYELIRWFQPHSSANFAHGIRGIIDPAITLSLFSLAIFLYRAEQGVRAKWMAIALVAFAGVDYKVFGTSKRLNAAEGNGAVYSSKEFGGMNTDAYRTISVPSDYRILVHHYGPLALVSRHVGWNTPQGFEPFLSTPYRNLVTSTDGEWQSDRLFVLEPMRLNVMDLYGVKFVIAGAGGMKWKELMTHPDYRMVGPNDSYYKVFEYLNAKPIYQFPGSVDVRKRDPEHRILQVNSEKGGLLTFSENGYPGWRATLDGRPVAIEPWKIAFQAVQVPPGQHTVEFIYRERLLPLGAAISLSSLALLGWWISADRQANSRSTYSKANHAVSG